MLGSVLGLLLASAPADLPTAFELDWEAPPECPTANEIRASVAGLVGTRADVDASGYVVVHARVEPSAEQWSMDFRIETATGARSRQWSAASCEELAEIAAVLIAVILDPGLAGDEPALASPLETDPPREPPAAADAPATAPSSAPDASPRPARPRGRRPVSTWGPTEGEESSPRPAQARRRRPGSTWGAAEGAESSPRSVRARGRRPGSTWRPTEGAVTFGGAFLYGALPGPAGGLAGAVALLWKHARWELGATGWFPRSQGLSGTSARADLGLWHLGSRGCGVPKVRRFEFPLCAGLELGAMTGQGRRLAVAQRRGLPWFAAEASAMAVVRLIPEVALFMGARVVVPVLRPGFELDGVVVHRAAAAAFSALLGIEGRWRWPVRGAQGADGDIRPSARLLPRKSRGSSNIQR